MSDKKMSINFPKSSSKINLTVDGLFAYPEEWKTTDEGNPGMFTYKVKMGSLEVLGGKINPRQMTQKELREQQDSKKKGGKKQAKKQENPAEAEKLKQQMEKQQEEQRRKQEEFNKLSQEEKFYHTNQDPFKSALLKFQTPSVQSQIQGKKLVIFEERVTADKGQWIYIYKMPTANQEQLAKLKKAKPKNLNANDLNPVCMRAWVDLSGLASSQQKSVEQRCKIEQINKTQQSPTPNLQNTYIKVKINLQNPLISKKDVYTMSQIIKKPQPPKQVPPEIRCVDNLKNELRLGMESLAMEYSSMFFKQLNLNQQQKQANIFGSSKKNQHTKRKQQFLYDFNISGKYKILKERLKKHIVYLCENKYADQMKGEKSFTGITCSVRDQFYSEIYNFLVSSYSETMDQLIEQNKQKWQQVEVLSHDTQQHISNQHLKKFKPDQSVAQRIVRNIAEYNLIGQVASGRSFYEKQLKENPTSIQIKYQYSLYCLKNGLKQADDGELVKNIEQYLSIHSQQNEEAKLFYVLLLIQSQSKQQLQKAWIILRDMIIQKQSKPASENPFDNVVQYLYSTLLFDCFEEIQLSEKYQEIVARKYLRNSGKINKEGEHKENPLASQVPTLEGLAQYQQSFSAEQKNELWLKISMKLLQLNLTKCLTRVLKRIQNTQTIQYKKIQIGIELANKNYENVLTTAKQLYKQTKNPELIQTIILCYLMMKDYSQAERYLKISMKILDANGKINSLFILGKLYIDMGKYGNAKACLIKYIEAGKDSCGGLSWKLLGITQFKLGNMQASAECLRFANLNNPKDADVWIALAEVEAARGNYIMVNQCLNSYEYSHGDEELTEADKINIKNIEQLVKSKSQQSYYKERMRKSMQRRLNQILAV